MFNKKITENLSKSSFIRAMFEEGNRLKAIYGEKNVYDFSIGNPEMEPPVEVKQSLLDIAMSKEEGMHKYMSNAGYEQTRKAVAKSIKNDYDYDIPYKNIIMSAGAAAGLFVTLKSILNPDDEVIVFKPYFAEYGFYVMHAQGNLKVADCDESFMPDIDSFMRTATSRTKAVIINTPNNPSGVIYPKEVLLKLNEAIRQVEKKYNTDIFVLSDEPYAKIVFDDATVPCVFKCFDKAIIINSYSKSLALPGERIGYIAVDHKIPNAELLLNICIFNTRTLGYVNAPALIQRVIQQSCEAKVDVEDYKRRRDLLYNHMIECGFSIKKPQGAFYLFVKSPVEDEMEFVEKAKGFNILIVPGRGFGMPGYIRMCFCVSYETIKSSLPKITQLAKEYFK
ncbi:MAG TPA: pyridoxal phosphate-dependent aminotransferase [Clostridia bacterium]|nr:pyridoxal phosphate-dependent aminotransferase [Clostridia bacterium]HPJ76502.1 pyridoxal phosphate-dependent aminotransferase [Clostridia bacterium]HXK71626.1 pyridoxal phosphate-dependent aminotransferase [Clostridia bacterium]